MFPTDPKGEAPSRFRGNLGGGRCLSDSEEFKHGNRFVGGFPKLQFMERLGAQMKFGLWFVGLTIPQFAAAEFQNEKAVLFALP